MVNGTIVVYGARNKTLLTTSVNGRSIDSVMVHISKAIRKHRNDVKKYNSNDIDVIANWRGIQIFVTRINKKIAPDDK